MQQQNTSVNWLHFFDRYILLIVSAFLLIFIPLYPKIPLFDLIEGYIVRARLEDILIAAALGVYFIQLLRKKITLGTPLTKLIFAYTVVGFFSTLSGIFLTQTIPSTEIHLAKSFLHFVRYIEYFSLFFLLAAAVKTKKDVKLLLGVLVTTVLLVGLYGLGQKYLYWPVYSTMNREFSKGIVLYLTEHARVQSTFAGHYDMAAYLVILLPIILSLLFQQRLSKISTLLLWSTYLLGLLLMMLSASRTSLAGLVVGLFLVIFLTSILKKNWYEKYTFFLTHSLINGLIFMFLFIFFGSNMADRLLQVVENYPQFIAIQESIEQTKQELLAQISPDGYTTFNIQKPENGLSTEQAEVLVASDTRPTPIKPSDVYVDVPDQIRVATISAEGEKEFITIEVPRTYSENALKHGLSMAIRLDTLWPQALQGFYTNPVLGSGYATLTKATVGEFTQADSTDNNFLRTLGETGLLGFITFYGIIFLALKRAKEIIFDTKDTDDLKKLFATGFIGATLGLLINAFFIDVFAASKVAYTYWAVTGILMAYPASTAKKMPAQKGSKNKSKSKKKTFLNT